MNNAIADSGIPLVVCFPTLSQPPGACIFKGARKSGRAEIPIIAMGSMGAIGGRASFIVHILSVQARLARQR
jgi:hypothetical protein